jgi:hypothetical protein
MWNTGTPGILQKAFVASVWQQFESFIEKGLLKSTAVNP